MMSGAPGCGPPAPGPPNPGPPAVVQVTNLSAAVSSEQLRTLFGFLGHIEELRLYPPDHAPLSFSSKVCYVKYREAESVGVAQHLTNTVFLDRALIVVPCAEGRIPEESKALSLLAPAAPPAAGLLPLPTQAPPLQSLGVPLSGRVSSSLDSSSSSSSSQPPLVGNVDPSKVDEIRRTVYVGNLNSQSTTADQLLEFFRQVGEVKFVRMAGDETQPTRFAFVEFVEQNAVARALTYNGVMFRDRPLKVNHSNNAIVKPPEMTPQAAAKELEVVMKRVREAQSTIAAAIEPETKESSSSESRRPHRTKSRSRSRSRTQSRTRRKRSRSRTRASQRSWSGGNSHGCHGNQRHSRERRSTMSRSRVHRRRSKDRSRSPRTKLTSPSPRRGRRERRRERRERRERSSSRKRSRREEERMRSRAPLMKVENDRAEKESEGADSATPTEEVNSSPSTVQHNGSYRTHQEEEEEEEEEEEDADSTQ